MPRFILKKKKVHAKIEYSTFAVKPSLNIHYSTQLGSTTALYDIDLVIYLFGLDIKLELGLTNESSQAEPSSNFYTL